MYLLPALAALAAVPLLRMWLSARGPRGRSCRSAILLWSLTANLFRPDVFDTPVDDRVHRTRRAGHVLRRAADQPEPGCRAVAAAPPFRPADRDRALPRGSRSRTRRLAASAPERRWSCTASSCSSSCCSPRSVRSSTRRRTRPSRTQVRDGRTVSTSRARCTQGNPSDVLRSGQFAGRVVDVMPLVIGHATASDPGHRTEGRAAGDCRRPPEPHQGRTRVPARSATDGVRGRPGGVVGGGERSRSTSSSTRSSDRAAAPKASRSAPGDTFTITDPETGAAHVKTIAGVMSSRRARFYNIGVGEFGFPVLTSAAAATADCQRRTRRRASCSTLRQSTTSASSPSSKADSSPPVSSQRRSGSTSSRTSPRARASSG